MIDEVHASRNRHHKISDKISVADVMNQVHVVSMGTTIL